MSTIPKLIKDEIDAESELRYPVTRHNNPSDSPYVHSQITFRHGVQYGYQLATDGREELEKEIATLKTPRGSDEYWNKLDQNFGKTQDYHYTGDKCVAGCKRFSYYETRHHKDCPFYQFGQSKVIDEQLESQSKRISELEEGLRAIKTKAGFGKAFDNDPRNDTLDKIYELAKQLLKQ